MYRKIIHYIRPIKYVTFRKVKNLTLIYLSHILSKKKIRLQGKFVPAFISVEPSDFCQLECPECPVGINSRRKGSLIDMDLFEKSIKEIKDRLLHIIFYFQGEPLLNRNLHKMIHYAHSAGIYTSTSTNGQAMTNERAKEIVESGLDKLIISIDGVTQDVYEKYRKGGSLEKAKNAIHYINYWKKNLKSVSPMIEVQFIVFGTNEHQIKEIKKLSKVLKADRLALKTAQIYNFENGSELIPLNEKYSRYKKLANGKFEIKNKLHNHCLRLWSGAVINVNGDVLPCCFDKNAEYKLGNLNEENLSDTMNGERTKNFRKSILYSRIQHEICRNCTER